MARHVFAYDKELYVFIKMVAVEVHKGKTDKEKI